MKLRAALEPMLRAALAAAEPEAATRAALAITDAGVRAGGIEIPLANGAIHLVGAGKATAAMARGAISALPSRIAGGTLTLPTGSGAELPGIDRWEATHPIPGMHGMAGAAEALALARRLGEGDLLLCLLSGGASALWTAPAPGLTLRDLQATTAALLRAAVPISEVNAVRKHLSRIGGGQLARAAAPARVMTLAVADVIGAGDASIGSGPTLPDPSTFGDAIALRDRFDLHLPPAALRYLQAGALGERPETVKPGELHNLAGFQRILDVRHAIDGAIRAAEEAGFRAVLVDGALEGEAHEAGDRIAELALRAQGEGQLRTALVWGGETTVAVRGAGTGGRNQELALAAAIRLAGHPGIALAALATDGRDGPTDAAGAIVDDTTTARGGALGLSAADHLAANDSYHYLDACGDLLRIGPTGTNVNDLVLALIE